MRYDEATRMRIVDYAQLHGVAAASRHFSSELSAPVSESTIRSMREKLIGKDLYSLFICFSLILDSWFYGCFPSLPDKKKQIGSKKWLIELKKFNPGKCGILPNRNNRMNICMCVVYNSLTTEQI